MRACEYIYIYIYACTYVSLNFITGHNEREETTQDTIVTKSAACASYKSNCVTYITATYTCSPQN